MHTRVHPADACVGQARPSARPQAWAIAHLDPNLTGRNRQTLDGVARVLLQHPEVCLEIQGMTTTATTAEVKQHELKQHEPMAMQHELIRHQLMRHEPTRADTPPADASRAEGTRP